MFCIDINYKGCCSIFTTCRNWLCDIPLVLLSKGTIKTWEISGFSPKNNEEVGSMKHFLLLRV